MQFFNLYLLLIIFKTLNSYYYINIIFMYSFTPIIEDYFKQLRSMMIRYRTYIGNYQSIQVLRRNNRGVNRFLNTYGMHIF